MMSHTDIDARDQAAGNDAGRLFLTGMIKHHEGAITMARDQVADSENPEAVALSQKIITEGKIRAE